MVQKMDRNCILQWTKSRITISCVVIGKPSASLADKLEEAEKARIADLVSRLGPEGLEEAERKLEAATKDHRRSIPPDILTSFPIPDVKGISWIPVQTVQEHQCGASGAYCI